MFVVCVCHSEPILNLVSSLGAPEEVVNSVGVIADFQSNAGKLNVGSGKVEIGFDRSIVFSSRLLTHDNYPSVGLTIHKEKRKQITYTVTRRGRNPLQPRMKLTDSDNPSVPLTDPALTPEDTRFP